jgi:hypothetical protein
MRQIADPDATPDGGVSVEASGEVDKPASGFGGRRSRELDSIGAEVRAQREAEMGLPEGESGAKAAPEDQVQAQLDDGLIDDPQDKLVRVKVDGVERDVPLTEVLSSWQKGAAADRRLEEATRLLREAQQAVVEKPAAPVEQQKTGKDQAPETESAQSAELEALVDATLDALYGGDQSVAREALVKLVSQTRGGPAPTPVLPEIDYGEVASRVQQLREVDTALEKIRTDYPDILSFPDLELLTAIKVDAAVAAGASRPTAMLAAAEEVYALLGKESGRRQQDRQRESRDEKLLRKSGRDFVSPATAAADLVSDATPDRTPVQAIHEIAARRMGQSLMIGQR